MILYLTNNRTFVGTQADARRLDRNFVQVDVPTDKAGLMEYLNDLIAVTARDTPTAPPVETAPAAVTVAETVVAPQDTRPPTVAATPGSGFSSLDVEEYIWNADLHQTRIVISNGMERAKELLGIHGVLG